MDMIYQRTLLSRFMALDSQMEPTSPIHPFTKFSRINGQQNKNDKHHHHVAEMDSPTISLCTHKFMLEVSKQVFLLPSNPPHNFSYFSFFGVVTLFECCA
jgi:hypothetical protein